MTFPKICFVCEISTLGHLTEHTVPDKPLSANAFYLSNVSRGRLPDLRFFRFCSFTCATKSAVERELALPWLALRISSCTMSWRSHQTQIRFVYEYSTKLDAVHWTCVAQYRSKWETWCLKIFVSLKQRYSLDETQITIQDDAFYSDPFPCFKYYLGTALDCSDKGAKLMTVFLQSKNILSKEEKDPECSPTVNCICVSSCWFEL